MANEREAKPLLNKQVLANLEVKKTLADSTASANNSKAILLDNNFGCLGNVE